MDSQSTSGIDSDAVARWMSAHVSMTGDLRFDLVTHGRSNLTFIVTDDAAHRWVLRRPPTGHLLASAHDMAREHRIIGALADTAVPVPAIVGFCDDVGVTGAPFYVMDFVKGRVYTDLAAMADVAPHQCAAMSTSLVDTLVELHEIEPDSVGLGDLGRTEDYVARQLRRWKRQVDEGSDRVLPLFDELHRELVAAMPPQRCSGIVHGDYRLDNTMIGDDDQVVAVLDWELCTLGDVLADLGGLVMWWGERGRRGPAVGDVATLAPGHLEPAEVIRRYGSRRGLDVSDLGYYVAFAFWRLAAIIEGVRTRFAAGAMGGKDIGDELAGFGERIDALLEESRRRLRDGTPT